MIYRPKILERVNNWFLQVKACMHFKKNPDTKRVVNPPNGYSYYTHSNLTNNLDTDFWLPQQYWGWFHPNNGNPIEYYDKELKYTKASKEGTYLCTKYDPKNVLKNSLSSWEKTKELPEKFSIPYRVGLLSSRISFKYGWFKIEAKLPSGKNLCPSFCLNGVDTWPPEIDVFNGYSGEDGNYSSGLFKNAFKKIQPNIHYGSRKDNSTNSWSGYDVFVKDADKRFVQYVCWWERDFIKIYYDGVKVFETYDQKILKYFNQPMSVIINNGVTDLNANESSLIIKNFEVWTKK